MAWYRWLLNRASSARRSAATAMNPRRQRVPCAQPAQQMPGLALCAAKQKYREAPDWALWRRRFRVS